MSRIKRIMLLLLTLLGLGLSVKLFYIYMDVNFNPQHAPSFCNINSYVDCDAVAKTSHALLFGIPNALWGIFLYLLFLFLIFVDKIKKLKFLPFLEVFKNPLSYIASLGVLSFAVSVILACVSIFAIEKICILCFVTYFINLFIAIIARTPGKDKGFEFDIKTSVADLLDGIKKPIYLIMLSFCVLIFGVFVAVINHSKVFSPPKPVGSIMQYAEMKTNPYKVSGNILGDRHPKVIVNLYTDYQCPHCRILNIMLHQAMQDVKGVMIVHHDFPLDTECNPLLRHSMHKNSCMLARYSLAAAMQGKAWDMSSLLFDNKFQSEKDVLKTAKKIKGLDIEQLEKDANSNIVSVELKQNINAAIERNVKATPTMLIGARIYTGTMPYDELIKVLTANGAEPRNK